MRKPDVLILLAIVALLGAFTTSISAESKNPAQLSTLESSIR